MGCDPDAITCFLSTREREILKDNVQPNSVLHVDGEIIIMKENKKETKFNPIPFVFPRFRYIGNSVLQYEGVNPLEKLISLNQEELIQGVYKNHGILKGLHSRSWVFSYLETILYGFNVFAMSSQLNDDVLRAIRSYL
jgi:hypothetical protein